MAQVDVHELKPGALGLVAHQMKPSEPNAWTKRVDVNPTKQYTWDLMSGGNLYKLDSYIPHGTLVLILSKKILRKVSSDRYFPYYEVLWGETRLFIRTERVINPYLNSEEL